ncbi:MAG: dNTP triphosphohydrolase [Lachnospiraceae bacterium]|nr:dNTP triphosphohydrolase [Lachnospiraceae bacterium]
MTSDALIMIKVKDDATSLLQRFKASYDNHEEGEYKVISPRDKEILKKVSDNGSLSEHGKIIVVFEFFIEVNQYKINNIYLGICHISKDNEDIIKFIIKKRINNSMVINNILSYSELDLQQDFEKKSYVNVEYSEALISQLQELLYDNWKQVNVEIVNYGSRREEDYLSEYAQHNEDCRRKWYSTKAEEERSEFQRDRERIVNSKAFRRMVDKAQIFTSSKGDHYRTRMTHTLEVAQIARSIGNSLRLNIDLTEAIALGHDLGHTPFGHQGERTLDDIINGRTEILPKLFFEDKNPYGGFKHNFQSLRMLTKLEEKYIEHGGLDVSYQVLEGVLKHTSNYSKHCINCSFEKCKKGCCDYNEYVDEETRNNLYEEYAFATTLEGQTVAIADEIAQRGHDIDDVFSSGLLSFHEFEDYLKLSKLEPLYEIIMDTHKCVMQQENRILIDKQEMLTARVISDIISYLVNDVVDTSKTKLREYKKTDFYIETHRFDQKLVDFSKTGLEVCALLEKMISKRAINCLEVTKFDRNADKIVKCLFEAYYCNAKLMHSGTLRRMYIDMLEVSDNVIDFVKADPILVKKELEDIRDYKYPDNRKNWTDKDEEYYHKRKILIRNIVDFIAGMTDSYAINEYNDLR